MTVVSKAARVLTQQLRALVGGRVQTVALVLSAVLCASALARQFNPSPPELNAIPEVADFRGVNDPPDASREDWRIRRDGDLDDMVDEVHNYPGVTTDLLVPGESRTEHELGLFPEAAGMIRGAGAQTGMGELLKDRTVPGDVRGTNPYAAMTGQTSDQLRKRILAAPKGSLSPADVMRSSLDVTNGNYPLATLTALDVLKTTTQRGRNLICRPRPLQGNEQKIDDMCGLSEELADGNISQAEYDRHMAGLQKALAPYSEIASRLENMRAFPAGGQNDKMGPWYHTWGILAAGAVHGPTDAVVGTYVENWKKAAGGYVGEGSPNPEKEEIDSEVAWRVADPSQLGTYQRDYDIDGPHPSVFIPGYGGHKAQAQCLSAKKRVKDAAGQMNGTVAPVFISAARAEIAKVKGQIAECAGLGALVAQAESAAKTAADQWLQGARSAVNSCDSEFIRQTARDTALLADDANSSEIASELLDAAQNVDQAQDKVETEIGLYAAHRDAGNLGLARKALLDAKAALAPLSSSGCFAGEQARIDDLIAQIDKLEKAICEGLSARMDVASTHYQEEGGFIKAKNEVGAVREELGKTDSTFCPEVRERVAKAVDKIDKLTNGLDKITAVIDSCDARAIANYRGQLAAMSNLPPVLQEKLAELDRIAPQVAGANTAFDEATAAYDAGDLAQAGEKLQSAEDQVKALNGKPPCSGLVDRIASGRSKINRVDNILDQADAAIKTCDVGTIDALQSKLGAVSGMKSFRYKATELEQAKGKCGQEAIEAANADCVNLHGSGSSAGIDLADGSYYCVPGKAAANAQCVELNGPGHYAVNIQGDGSFGCLPTKATANAWCSSNNGKGWYAGKVKSDGSYNCHMGKSARNASCRQYGSGWYAGKVRSDGTFMCYGPRQAQPRGGPRGPSAGEVGAAIAGAIAEGLAASQRGRGGGGGGRKCHRSPDGRIHCGSN